MYLVTAETRSERLVLINRNPGPEETNVSVDNTISLNIVCLEGERPDYHSTKIWVDAQPAFDAGILPEYYGPRARHVWTANSLRIWLDPLTQFTSEATVEVRVESTTIGGTHSLAETYRFHVEDRTAPEVVNIQAVSAKTVRIEFNEAVRVTDPVGFEFNALTMPAVPLYPILALTNDTVVEVTVNTEMTPLVEYEVVVTGVEDLNDNVPHPPTNKGVFRGFQPATPSRRRFRLWEMLPKHNRREDDTGDLWRFISCLQEVTDLLLSEIDRFTDIFDIERAPENFLDLILLDLGNPFIFELDALQKARLASTLVELYKQKGTEKGIVNAIRFFLGIEVEVLPLTADLLGLGEAKIGVNWILGPSDRAALYSFDVRVIRELTVTERRQIRTIVDYMKPAHTHFISLLEPGLPPSDDAWELGISLLGVASRLG